MLRIVSLLAYPMGLPLAEPFVTSRGRATRSRTVLIKATLDTGVIGLGEATPLRYVTGEGFRSVRPMVKAARRVVQNADPSDWRELSIELEKALPQAVTARAGIETAILDAAARSANQPLCEFLGGRNGPVVTDETISALSPRRAAEAALESRRNGITRLKIKADGTAEDVLRVLAVARAVPEAELKVDANQAFTPEEAVAFVEELEKLGIKLSLLEQPVAKTDIIGLKHVTDNVSVPVFADESAVSPDDVRQLADLGAVNGVNVKLMKCGFRGALEIVEICRQAGLKLMLGCMLESRVGISAALHLACATQAFDHFDLDSDQLIAKQPVTGGFERKGDTLTLTGGPGLGCRFTR